MRLNTDRTRAGSVSVFGVGIGIGISEILVENRIFLVGLYTPPLFGAPFEGDMHSVIMLFE